MTALAKWWLQRHGYYLVPPGFVGVVLGCQTVLCRDDGMHIVPNGTHSEIVALNQSIVIQRNTGAAVSA